MTVKWIVAPYAFDGRIGGNIHEVAMSMGYDVDICDFIESLKRYTPPNDYEDRPVILYGSIPFVRRNHHRYCPGAFGLAETSVSKYMSQVPSDWFLNGDGVLITYGMLKDRFRKLQDMLGAKRLFVRPESGFKPFTGFVIDDDNFAIECLTLEQVCHVQPDDMLFVATAKDIGEEYRYVIIDGQVVASSDYNWNDFDDIKGITDPVCDAMAKLVAGHGWQPDIAYTVDVTLYRGEPKIVEYNSFSCSGFYGCNLRDIVYHASLAAEKVFRETFDI